MRVAVVGAGIAGLTAALGLARSGAEVVVFEGSDRIGGKLRLAEVGGLTVDVGAESILARRPEGIDLMIQAGLDDDITHPSGLPAQLWSRGRLEPIPPSVLGVPAEGSSTPVEVPDGDVSVAEFVAAAVGRDVVDRYVEPLLGGVYAGHADRLSLRAAAPQVLALAPDLVAGAAAQRAAASSTPVFAGLRGGVGRLPLAIAALGEFEIRLNSTVRFLETSSDGWSVAGESFDAVVLAAPAPAAARLLAGVAPDAAFALAGVDYASVAIATFVLEGAALPETTGFLVPPIDGTAIKASTFSTRKWPWLAEAAGDRHVVRASLGRAGETSLLQRSDDEVLALALADLQSAVSGTGALGTVVDSHVQRWGGALPQYEVGHLDLVATVERSVAAVPGLEVCGAAYRGMGIAAVVASANAAAGRVATMGRMGS